MMDPAAGARAIRDLVAAGGTSAVDVCRLALDRISEAEPALHAFVTITADRALERAAELDARRDKASLPLAGVPVAIKDNLCTRGVPTTAGSRMLSTYRPPYDATVVERLERAGAIVVGKTNCDEFAMGSSTENSAFGPTRNPWALDRTPGGSSGGSAAAVAARLVPVALGSDTGGSVRQPAALCGITGFRPSYGRVSRYGLVAFASSIDQVGPMTTSVADAALIAQAIAGPDSRDSTTAATAGDFDLLDDDDLRWLRVAVPRRELAAGVEPGVMAAFDAALETLSNRGATMVDVELPHNAHAVAVYYIVATAEASSNLARYDGVRFGTRSLQPSTLEEMYERTRGEGFGLEVKRRIVLGTYVLSAGYYDAYYAKAQQVRTLIRQDYEAALARADVVAVPTSPTTAFRLGERTGDPLSMYLADVFTVGAGLAGLPSISVPCGFSDGLPVGLQFTGRAMQDGVVLRAAHAYERATPWSRATPPLRR